MIPGLQVIAGLGLPGIFSSFARMRKVPDIPFPISAWVQTLVQLGACLALMLPLGWSPSVVAQLSMTEGSGQWFWALGLWLVFGLLLGEVVVRQAQNLGFFLFPGRIAVFRLLTFAIVVAGLLALFVTLETLLIWMEAVMQPSVVASVAFGQQWLDGLRQDGLLAAVFAAGEALRQWRYRRAIRSWWDAKHWRKNHLPPAEEV